MGEGRLKGEIFARIKEYYELVHKQNEFVPGRSKIHYAGRVFDEKEMLATADVLLEFKLTLGRYGKKFEEEFSKFLGLSNIVLTNSGSSANLLAISALCSPQLKNRLKPGDEVITPAATFPTTINPIIQNNLLPVLIDVELGTYNIAVEKMEDALSEKTKAIMIPHTLGNPNDMDYIMDFVEDNSLYLIEDACDALNSKYNEKLCGTFGTAGTFSFYPAHHITMGEGGAVATNDALFARVSKSIRDWGRACYCEPGETDPYGACGRRFSFKVNDMPYDHKYLYANIGYNLKPLDFQCAIGLEQLKKLPRFTEVRKRNFGIYYEEFSNYEEYFILPKALPKAEPSWFAFPLTVRKEAPFSRKDIVEWYEKNSIETRLLFGGNITKQPAYKNVNFKVIEDLKNSDLVMTNTFFIGVYPGLTEEMTSYVIEKTREFVNRVD